MANEARNQQAGTFDVAAGADETAINTLAESLYKAIYPHILKGSASVNALNISSIDYDVQAPPTFTFQPSQHLMDLYRAFFGQQLEGEEMETSLSAFTQASFDGNISKIVVTINYLHGLQPTGPLLTSMDVTAQMIVNTNGTLTLQLLTGTITVQGDPLLSQILTDSLAPWLVDYLNTHMLAPITLPVLNLLNVSLSTPVVVSEGTDLLMFTAIQPAQANPPPPSQWPAGVVFLAADAQVLDAVANDALAEINPSGNWSDDINLLGCTLTLAAQYNLQQHEVSLNLAAGSGNIVTADVSASGSASFNAAGCGFVNVSFGASISATATATVEIAFAGETVIATFKGLSNLKITVDFNGVPPALNSLLNDILGGLIDSIGETVINGYSGQNFNVFTIPPVNFAIDNMPFTLTLTQLALQTISGPGNVPLLTVTGLAGVQRSIPIATLSSTTLDFQSVPVGTSPAPTAPVKVTNTGSASLVITGTSISGDPSFTLSDNQTCQGATLAPGESCTAMVEFDPEGAKVFHATLTFTDNAGNSPQQVLLKGTGRPSNK